MKKKLFLFAVMYCIFVAPACMAQTDNLKQNNFATSDTMNRVRDIITASAWGFNKVEILQIKSKDKTYSLVHTIDKPDSLYGFCNYLGLALKRIVFIGDRANAMCACVFIHDADYEILPIDSSSAFLKLSWQNNVPAEDLMQEIPIITVMYKIIVKNENKIEIIYDADSPDETGKLVSTNAVSILERLN